MCSGPGNERARGPRRAYAPTAAIHLPAELGVALHELRRVAAVDPEQVVEDQHLAVGRRRRRRSRSPGRSASRISTSVIAAGTASKTIAKQPAACSASASSAIRTARSAVLPWVLKPPSAVAVCGVSPTWPITGIPAPDDRPGALDRGAAALELDRVAAGLLDEALRVRDRLLVGELVGAERHVADQQRRPQPAADRLRQHQHLVHARPASSSSSRAPSSRRCRRPGPGRRRPPRRPRPRGSRRR